MIVSDTVKVKSGEVPFFYHLKSQFYIVKSMGAIRLFSKSMGAVASIDPL